MASGYMALEMKGIMALMAARPDCWLFFKIGDFSVSSFEVLLLYTWSRIRVFSMPSLGVSPVFIQHSVLLLYMPTTTPMHVTGLVRQLIGVRDVDLALLEPQGTLFLRGDMLDPALLHLLLLKCTNKDGIPQLGRNTQILAAAHQGIGLASLDGGGHLLDTEV